jgi:hypothetical protein
MVASGYTVIRPESDQPFPVEHGIGLIGGSTTVEVLEPRFYPETQGSLGEE